MGGVLIKRWICSVMLAAFGLTSVVPSSYAQTALSLPPPGQMVALSPAFDPPVLKGIKVYPDNPLRFDFILDKGDGQSSDEQIKTDSTLLIKYFLTSLTIPEKDLWVNLSPLEKDRIIPESFGKTEMGRDLLAQDYILKQISASLMDPGQEQGKLFWSKVYQQLFEKFGTTDIPIDTFQKIWIVPDEAVVYEQQGAVYVGDNNLKVMLEEDYIAQRANEKTPVRASEHPDISGIETKAFRSVLLPMIEKEVNNGKHFIRLRQIYHSLILAAWYKIRLKDGLLARSYIDRNKVEGIDSVQKDVPEKIWSQYMEAFHRGVLNFIKEETDQYTQEIIPRKYFSGGFQGEGMDRAMRILPFDAGQVSGSGLIIQVSLERSGQSPRVDTGDAARRYAEKLMGRGAPDMIPLLSLPGGRMDAAEKPAITFAPLGSAVAFPWQKFFSYVRDFSWQDLPDVYSLEGQNALYARIVSRQMEGRGNTHVFQQSGDEFSPVFELIDNSVDALFRQLGIDLSLGRFGEGSLQVLSYLAEELRLEDGQDKGDFVSWTTSTAEDKGGARRIVFFLKNGKIHLSFDRLAGDFTPGTTFSARLSRLERDRGFAKKMRQAVRRKYGDGNLARIYFDGELVNPRTDSVYFGRAGLAGKYLVDDRKKTVEITMFSDGFSVRDTADGMNDTVLLTKLPRPRAGENTPEALSRRQKNVDPKAVVDGEMSKVVNRERMRMQIYVGGRSMVEQDVPAGGISLPESLIIRLPATTTLTDDKNDIVVDEGVESAVSVLTEQFLAKAGQVLTTGDVALAVSMLNAYASAMMFFRRRAIAGNGYDFVEHFISQARNECLVPYLREHPGANVLLPRSLFEKIGGSEAGGMAVGYLEDVFFAGNMDLLDAALPRSRVFRGQSVYVLPSEDNRFAMPFGGEALFISSAQERTLAQAENPRLAAALMNAVLQDNGITRFRVPEEVSGVGTDEFERVLAGFQDERRLSGYERARVLQNLQAGTLSPDSLREAVVLANGEVEQASSVSPRESAADGVKIVDVPSPIKGSLGLDEKVMALGQSDEGLFLVSDPDGVKVIDTKQEGGEIKLRGDVELSDSIFVSVNQGRFVMHESVRKKNRLLWDLGVTFLACISAFMLSIPIIFIASKLIYIYASSAESMG